VQILDTVNYLNLNVLALVPVMLGFMEVQFKINGF